MNFFFWGVITLLFIISPNSAIFLLSRTSSNSKVFGILTTRTSNPFWATATANVIYRTWLFFQVCLQHCISLEVKWISRDLNVSADYISKFVGFDDYVLWGPRTIDGFACSYNGKLPRFNCSILSARLRGSLISKLGLRQQQLALSSGLSHCRSHQAHEGVPSSGNPCSLPMEVSFFSGMPLIAMECTGIALLSTGYIYLSSRGYCSSRACNSLFESRQLDFNFVALRVNFRCPRVSLLPGGLLLFAWRKVLPVLLVACYAYTFRSGAIRFCT